MRKKGAFLIAMGLLLIAAALSLTAYNIWDADRADKAAQSAVQSLRELIPQNGKAQAAPEEASLLQNETGTASETVPGNVTEPSVKPVPANTTVPSTETAPGVQTVPGAVRHGVKIKPGAQTAPDIKKGIPNPLGEREMPTITLNGNRYIGVLDVQSLDLSLPVMEEWDYDKLKVSPCRFAGNLYQDDLVICAHNYPKHFTKLKYVPLGTEIKFTDAEGTEFLYAVSSVETIGPNDVEGMIHGDWDLTLFTCNTNGQTRCAIRCDRIN